MEIHSLQMMGFFSSICHVVFVVQEGPICDPDFIERVKIAELLKPSVVATKSFDEPDKMAEYSPEVVFIHNKVRSMDLNPQTYAMLRNQYEQLLEEGSHNFRLRTGLSGDMKKDSINLFLLPDVEDECNNTSFKECIDGIRKSLNKLQLRPFSNNVKQCEKTWFTHSQKVWEQIKSSSFYLEYSRLLRLKSV